MRSHLEGKAAIVTGGAAGIGRATALLLAEHGANVLVADVSESAGRGVVDEIGAKGVEARFLKTDVADDGDVRRMVQECLSAFSRLDIAVNNAGIEGEQAPTARCDPENWQRVIAINLTGVWQCMRHEIPPMLEGRGGAIVNMSSVAGLVGFPNLPAYVAAKHGVIGLTRAAALEYAQDGVRVNAICPGVIRTEMVERVTGGDPETERSYADMSPVGRMGTPEEIAEAIVWLSAEGSSFVTGHPLVADGGLVVR